MIFRVHVERVTREDATVEIDADDLAHAKDIAEARARNQDIDFRGEVVSIEIQEAQ